jgi:hypothetical protein
VLLTMSRELVAKRRSSRLGREGHPLSEVRGSLMPGGYALRPIAHAASPGKGKAGCGPERPHLGIHQIVDIIYLIGLDGAGGALRGQLAAGGAATSRCARSSRIGAAT